MANPLNSIRAHNENRPQASCSRGFTLMELMVVIAIISVVSLTTFSLMGALDGGDPVRASASAIRAMVQRGRSTALARDARYELLLDFETNRITPFERKPVAFFSFETPFGSGGRMLNLSNNASIDGTLRSRRDGKCLTIGGKPGETSAGAVVPYQPEFNPGSEDDGLAISFDLRPEFSRPAFGIVMMRPSRQWVIYAARGTGDVITLSAEVRGLSLRSDAKLPNFQWSHIELVISPLSLRLYVNNIPTAAALTQAVHLDPFDESPVIVGGDVNFVPISVDNLRFEQLNVGLPYDLPEGVWLLPPGGDPERAAARTLYTVDEPEEPGADGALPPDAGGPTNNTQPSARRPGGEDDEGVPIPIPPPMPLDAAVDSIDGFPVRRALILFDSRGQLDLNFHQGPLRLALVGRAEDGFAYRHFVDVSILGVITDAFSGDEPPPPPTELPPEEGGEPAGNTAPSSGQ